MLSLAVNPLAIVHSIVRHRHLIWQLSKREVIGRYRGSVLGLFWSFFQPLLMLGVYTFVFGVVFKARWGTGSEGKFEFAITLFTGLVVHALFTENLMRAPVTILSNENYVKRVVFPLEALPWVNMFSALFHALVSLLVLLLMYVLAFRELQWTIVFLPVVIFPLVVLAMGVCWFLASLGVFFRDVGQIMNIVTTVLLFLSPILYPVSFLPESYRIYIYLNPLTFIIEQTRNVILWGKTPDFGGLALYMGFSLLIAWLGLMWFLNTKKGFADVL